MKKKLFFFIAHLYHGGERVITDISLHLSEEIDTTFVLFEHKISYPIKGRVINLGIPLSTNPFLRAWRFFPRLLAFKKILDREKPDYVVSMGNSANMINILINPRAIVRVDMHPTLGNQGFWGWLYRIFIRLFFPRAALIISVSKEAAQDLIDSYKVPAHKIKVIYNPLLIDSIKKQTAEPLPAQYAHIFQKPVIITAGRLTRQKGQRHLLSAFKRVQEMVKNAQLVILGEGELKPMLEELAKKLGIRSNVHFLGWQKNPYTFFSRSRVFVLSSLWEGLPTVLLEAMACGIPVVSTDCKSGPREILERGGGILVPVGDETALADAIIRIMSDPILAQKLSEVAQQRAEDFNIKKIIPQWSLLLS